MIRFFETEMEREERLHRANEFDELVSRAITLGASESEMLESIGADDDADDKQTESQQ